MKKLFRRVKHQLRTDITSLFPFSLLTGVGIPTGGEGFSCPWKGAGAMEQEARPSPVHFGSFSVLVLLTDRDLVQNC